MRGHELLMVGAGLSGAVLARQLAEAGHRPTVIDQRDHVAGNCHTRRDPETGVLVHVYGPHIFHTDDAGVWAYVARFARFRPYTHRVRTVAGGQVYSLPINLHTINQFFGTTLSPDAARDFLRTRADTSITDPQTFEQAALSMLGPELYHTFFEGYTRKQWGLAPDRIPASVLRRLPVRFSYDDNYFFHTHQGMPEDGYTPMVAAMLDHPAITVQLGTRFTPDMAAGFDHVFYSGPLDAWFGCDDGPLSYRTLDFERIDHDGDYQGCAVMNYADADTPWTRVTEHKHFAPWESHDRTVCYREYARACGPGDIAYYPVRLADDKRLLAGYETRARDARGVTFTGRLGTYRYLDMDVTIRDALDCAALYAARALADAPMPPFATDPA